MTARPRPNHLPTVASTTVALFDHPDYHRRACRDANPHLFLQSDGEQWKRAQVRMRVAAREYCRPCPVLAACRKAGGVREWGLWGGVAHRREGSGASVSVDLLKEGT